MTISGSLFDIWGGPVQFALGYEHRDESTNFDPGEFFEQSYPIPVEVTSAAQGGRVTIKFAAAAGVAGSVFDVRLIKTAR